MLLTCYTAREDANTVCIIHPFDVKPTVPTNTKHAYFDHIPPIYNSGFPHISNEEIQVYFKGN